MRDMLMNQAFFDKWIPWQQAAIKEDIEYVSTKPVNDPKKTALYIFSQIFMGCRRLLIRRYSRGDDIAELKAYIPELIKIWEWAYETEVNAYTSEELDRQKNFSRNFDYYIVCFWLASFGITLNISDDLFQRMIKIIGNEGQDALFDRMVATRMPSRKIGEKLLYPRPYQPLSAALDAPVGKQGALLTKFLNNWYPQMKRAGWHDCHTGLDGGGYFGYWCFEAVGVVKAFGIDDTSFRDMPYYPKDLACWKEAGQ